MSEMTSVNNPAKKSSLKKALDDNELWKALGFSVLFILLTSAQTVSLPLWGGSFEQENISGPYSILFYTSLSLTLWSFLFCLIVWYFKRYSIPPLNRYNVTCYAGCGVAMTINGFLLVYASLPNRTPEELQPILLSTQFMWSIPAVKYMIPEKKMYRYCQWKALIPLLLIFWGVVISLIPTIIGIIEANQPVFSDNSSVLWTLIFTLSIGPGAITNVYYERFFKSRDYSFVFQNQNIVFDTFYICGMSFFIQWVLMVSFFWLDFVPVYGFSSSFASFMATFKNASHCLFSAPMCPDTWWLGQIFINSFFLQSALATFMSSDSANFVNIAQTLSTPISSLFFVIFPSLNTGPQQPLGYLLTSMVLGVCGVIGFKIWEKSEEKKFSHGSIQYAQI